MRIDVRGRKDANDISISIIRKINFVKFAIHIEQKLDNFRLELQQVLANDVSFRISRSASHWFNNGEMFKVFVKDEQ